MIIFEFFVRLARVLFIYNLLVFLMSVDSLFLFVLVILEIFMLLEYIWNVGIVEISYSVATFSSSSTSILTNLIFGYLVVNFLKNGVMDLYGLY